MLRRAWSRSSAAVRVESVFLGAQRPDKFGDHGPCWGGDGVEVCDGVWDDDVKACKLNGGKTHMGRRRQFIDVGCARFPRTKRGSELRAASCCLRLCVGKRTGSSNTEIEFSGLMWTFEWQLCLLMGIKQASAGRCSKQSVKLCSRRDDLLLSRCRLYALGSSINPILRKTLPLC